MGFIQPSMGQLELIQGFQDAGFQKGSLKNKKLSSSKKSISLPIWDDFSQGSLDTTIWDTTSGTQVTQGIAYHPLTHGVATFDGLASDGRPYEFVTNFPKGATDYLESAPIDLSPYFAGDSVYLSFFWQQAGRGDAPEFSHRDSLMLDFYDAADTNNPWNLVWGRIGRDFDTLLVPGSGNINDTFFIAYVPILDNRYFRTDFKFRFRTRGTQSGPYDVWHIDYLYMNAGRSRNDFDERDRSPVEAFYPLFKTYSSIPVNHINGLTKDSLFRDWNSCLIRTMQSSDSFSVYNVSVKFTEDSSGAEFYNREFIGDLIQGQFSTQMFFDTTLKPLVNITNQPQSFRKTFYMSGVTDAPGRDVNDSLSIVGNLLDYYAYDDGSSEASVGVRKEFGKVAYQYILLEPDTLTAFDIEFKPAELNLTGQDISLRIWSKLNPVIDEVIYGYSTQIQFPEIGSNVHRFVFDSAVIVSDTIYIGWTQSSDALVHVGYDLNFNSTEKLYSKTASTGWRWEQDFYPGSMIFRPVFGKVDQPIAIGVQTPPPTNPVVNNSPYDVKVGPNPSSGPIKIYGEYDKIRVVDHHGRLIWEENGTQREELDLSMLEEGFYLIYFEKDFQFSTKRIFLKK